MARHPSKRCVYAYKGKAYWRLRDFMKAYNTSRYEVYRLMDLGEVQRLQIIRFDD